MPRPTYTITSKRKQRVFELARKGLNEEEISRGLKISYATFRHYRKQFLASIKKGREEGDELNVPIVENALLKRCRGYEYEEVQTRQEGKVIDGKLINGTITKTVTKKFIPPDVGAQIFYLSNRGKARWVNPMKLEAEKKEEKEIPVVSDIPTLPIPENKNEP